MKKVLLEIPDNQVELYEEYVQYVKETKNERIMVHNTKMFMAMVTILLKEKPK